MTVRSITRRAGSQENLDGRWSLGLRRRMQRHPARGIGFPRSGTLGQKYPQGIRVPIGSRVVHRRPPQNIPLRHADHATHPWPLAGPS
ncbi:hypothetical protein SCANM63S_01051 [Streptomyces canarius]